MELPYDDFDEEHPPHLYRNRFDPWNNMSDIEFRKDFRFSKENLTKICELVREDLERTCDRSHSLTVEQQVSMCVHLFGRNVMQADAARLSGCNQSSVSRILHAFLDSILKLKDDIITWPSEEERRNFAMTTLNEYRLPSITGYIDGTHIRIIVPTSNEPDYVNRKSYHSLNTVVICDNNLRVRWVSNPWPGSAHDSRIFTTSQLHADLTSGHKRGCLIGDSAFAADTFLIKPIAHPQNRGEQRFNESLCAARSKVENCFGILKRQFHCLHTELRYDVETCAKIFVVCCMLRNLSIDYKEPDNYDADLPIDTGSNVASDPPVDLTSGKKLMASIVSEYFR